MMNGQAAYQQYQKVQVETANRGKLLLMLYQGCVKFLRAAKKNIEEKDLEKANNHLLRSQDIIQELMSTLDREKGGQIAENLYQLYDFMLRHLVEANVEKSVEKIQVVEEMMVELLAAWEQIINKKNNKEEEKVSAGAE